MEIIFENENVIIVNKPAGMMVHTDGKTTEPTVVDWVLEHHPEIKGVGETAIVTDRDGKKVSVERPGIVHRLDRDTSGVLIIAKTQKSFEYLKQQFKDHRIEKTYLAVVYGWPKQPTGTIDASIGRSTSDFRKWNAGQGKRGKVRDATTEYKVLKKIEDHTEKFALVKLRPKTGRTHQLRVHLKYINHPIVADQLYGGKRAGIGNNLGFTRQALHALAIEFKDTNGEKVAVEAPLPQDFSIFADVL